jgi:NADPH:quinone reductase-like Zn-dependent oxidoreductase
MDAIKNSIPGNMLAIRQYEPDGKLVVETIPVPQPGRGEVLVKMAASPINPSDLALLKGGYMKRSYPFTPGLEGSGVVVDSGGGVMARLRKGKRVACTPNPEGDGTWTEFMLTSAMRTIPLPAAITQEQGAMTVVNPMTAMAFLHMAKTGKHPAVVNNAAASSLGKMLIRLCVDQKIPLINIVRNATHVEELKNLGASYVLNSQDKGFETELISLATELGATLFLDALSGPLTYQLLQAAPPRSTIVVYARLAGESMQINSGHLIRRDIKIVGFQLGNWLQTKGIFFKLAFIKGVKKQLGNALSSHINQTFSLEDVEKAIVHYTQNMSSGKALLLIKQKE